MTIKNAGFALCLGTLEMVTRFGIELEDLAAVN